MQNIYGSEVAGEKRVKISVGEDQPGEKENEVKVEGNDLPGGRSRFKTKENSAQDEVVRLHTTTISFLHGCLWMFCSATHIEDGRAKLNPFLRDKVKFGLSVLAVLLASLLSKSFEDVGPALIETLVLVFPRMAMQSWSVSDYSSVDAQGQQRHDEQEPEEVERPSDHSDVSDPLHKVLGQAF
jgi:hypothetical protein